MKGERVKGERARSERVRGERVRGERVRSERVRGEGGAFLTHTYSFPSEVGTFKVEFETLMTFPTS